MAEGFAAAASVIAVLQLTNSVISVCYDYSSAASGTSWELPRLRSELESLRCILQRLEPLAKQADFVQAVPDAELSAFSQLCARGGPLELCLHEVQSLEKVLKSPTWSDGFGPRRKALVQALRWPLKAKDSEKALERIQRLEDLLRFALDADHIALGLEIKRLSESTNIIVEDSQQTLASIQQMTMDIQDKVDLTNNATIEARKNFDSVGLETQRSAICDWLSAPDPSTNYHLGCRNRHSTTGSWFLGSEEFLQWTMDQSSILWMCGKAGCGKTVLSSTIITELRRQCNFANGVSLAYFFFDFNDSQKQQPSQMIRSLITQLLRLPNALPLVESLYASCSDGQEQADDESLLEILKEILQEPGCTYVVLDALDECSDIEYLLRLISEVVKWKVPSLHLLFSSRWLTLFEETMQDLSQSEHMVMIQTMARKIRHLRGNPVHRYRWIQWNDRRFRWAVCQLDALQKCPTIPSIRQALRSLPKTLDDTYAKMLYDIPEEYSEYAVTILRWLAHAFSPLRLGELAELFAVKIAGSPWFDPDARFLDYKDLLDICSGFVQMETDTKPDGYTYVRLAHFSVKEYLVSDRTITQGLQRYSIPVIQSHQQIAATCLAYLLHQENLDASEIRAVNYPLLMYAQESWYMHARKLGPDLGIVEDLVLQFLRRGSKPYETWVRRQLRAKPSVPVDLPPLRMMAAHRVPVIVQILVDAGHDVNEKHEQGTALSAASRLRNGAAMVRLLLRLGADPNHGRMDEPPLLAAAKTGDLEVLETLIDSGADLHYEDQNHCSALIAACISPFDDSDQKATLLLDRGANIHLTSKVLGNALHAACAKANARLELISMLISRGADVNAQGGKYGTALQAACAHGGNDKLIHFLLSKTDPCVEVQDSKYGTPLQALCAESSDNHEMVRLLLEHGARRNARGGKYGTALQAACSQGNKEVVRVLLQKAHDEGTFTSDEETDVNSEGHKYGTTLHAACRNRDGEIVTLLLEAGAHINANSAKFGTPLHVACSKLNRQAVKVLLEQGADVQILRRGKKPYTVLGTLLKSNPRDSKLLAMIDDSEVDLMTMTGYSEVDQIKIVRMLHECGVAETGLSPQQTKDLIQLKKLAGIPTTDEAET